MLPPCGPVLVVTSVRAAIWYVQAVQVQAVPYPGFATDLHPQIAAALTQAQGLSLVHERVYDNRTLYVNELRKLGARMITAGDTVLVEGPTPLVGSAVRCLDIRAGASVVVAALAVLQWIDVCHQVAAHTKRVNHFLDAGGLVELIIVVRGDVLRPANWFVGDGQ